MKISLHRVDGALIYTHECEGNTIARTIVKAKLFGAKLFGADLSGADLSGADLTGANLTGANLTGAKLSRAKLSWADLTGADLSWADLTGANLTGAKLSRANLSRADLTGADLDGERLSREPLYLLGLKWDVTITPGYLRIGCQRHTHTRWAGFSEEEIIGMDPDALTFWNIWGPQLLTLCQQARRDPTEVQG